MRSEKPKVLLPFLGRPMVLRALDAVSRLKPAQIVVVVGSGRELVEAAVSGWSTQREFFSVSCSVQEQQLGTGDAVKAGLSGVDSSKFSHTLIIPGDTPLLSEEVLKPFSNLSSVTTDAPVSVLTADVVGENAFGRIIRDGSGAVKKIVEVKDCSPDELRFTEVNSSVYLVETGFLSEALNSLKNENAQGEFYLTDIVGIATGLGKKVSAYKAKREIDIMGVNNRVELAALEGRARAEINQRHLLNGVALEDPANTYISEEAVIGVDSFIGAGTKIVGKTTIGAKVTIEGNCFIKDSNIADSTLLRFGCYLTESVVGPDATVGPFAQLRPGAELAAGVHIGNFVEVKNSKLGRGAKANHLAYIGDADVGAESNIGAGTIFCNYDGKKKHRSVVGERSFVGSNSTLVSPVKIGTESYVGAGSVITEDVPDKALALGRARQVVKSDWDRK